MSRFELVRVDGGWFVRFIARNGRIVWVTPGLYSRRRAALRAIEVMVDAFRGAWVESDWIDDQTLRAVPAVVHRVSSWEKADGRLIEIREVDERWSE